MNLYFRSKKSTRHSQEIAANPNVAGNIVTQHSIDEYPHAIYFQGTAHLLEDESRYQEMYKYFKRRQSIDETIIDDAKQEDGHKFYEIRVKNWYAFGKFGHESGDKYSLDWSDGENQNQRFEIID